MLYRVTLSNGETRVIEADELDVGPAGELRFTMMSISSDMYLPEHRVFAPGVWYEVEAKDAITEDAIAEAD